MGSDLRISSTAAAGSVSIHAPVWGATLDVYNHIILERVSIHAPVWGATKRLCSLRLYRISFNPRSRMGSDAPGTVTTTSPSEVSIHAPVWGATISHQGPFCNDRGFQSTLPYGERPSGQVYRKEGFMFQSTLPYGERPCCLSSGSPSRCFNPRSRMGSDGRRTGILSEIPGFNPRSRMGSDYFPFSLSQLRRVSIHAPVWGATAITYNFFTIFRDCLCNYNNIIVLIQAY